MIAQHTIPPNVHAGPDDLYGDVELFMKSYEQGEQSAEWTRQMLQNVVSNERILRQLSGASLVPGCI